MLLAICSSCKSRSCRAACRTVEADSSVLNCTSSFLGLPDCALPIRLHPFSATSGFGDRCSSNNRTNSARSPCRAFSGKPDIIAFFLRRDESVRVRWTMNVVLLSTSSLLNGTESVTPGRNVCICLWITSIRNVVICHFT